MIQEIIREIISSFQEYHGKIILEKPDLSNNKTYRRELLPVELATHLFDSLEFKELGWACGDDPAQIYRVSQCAQCYPVFRVRAIEKTDE